jgi:excisionase family DNA binding protein
MRAPLGEERRVDTQLLSADSAEALLVSRREAARLLGIGATTLDTLIRSKALHTVRISRRRLVVRASIFEYISHCQEAP